MAHDPYDAECIAGDLARYSEDIFLADVSEPYESPNYDGSHVFLLETPIGRRFRVTVTELAQAEDLCAGCAIPGHDHCGDGPVSRPYNVDCPCCRDTVAAFADNL